MTDARDTQASTAEGERCAEPGCGVTRDKHFGDSLWRGQTWAYHPFVAPDSVPPVPAEPSEPCKWIDTQMLCDVEEVLEGYQRKDFSMRTGRERLVHAMVEAERRDASTREDEGEVKPCPKCGSTRLAREVGVRGFMWRCYKCGFDVADPDSREAANELWNASAADAPPVPTQDDYSDKVLELLHTREISLHEAQVRIAKLLLAARMDGETKGRLAERAHTILTT